MFSTLSKMIFGELKAGPAPIVPGAKPGPAPRMQTQEDMDAASDFDVASSPSPFKAQAVPVRATAVSIPSNSTPAPAVSKSEPEPPKPVVAPAMPSPKSVFAKLRSEPDLAEKLLKLAAGSAELRDMRNEFNKRGLSSVEQASRRIEEIERSIPVNPSAADIEEAAAQIAALKAVTPNLCVRAAGSVRSKIDELSTLAHEILDMAEPKLKTLLADAQAAEQSFFAGHGLGHESTQVSRRVEKAAADVQAMRSNLPPRHGDEVAGQANVPKLIRMHSEHYAWVFDPSNSLHSLVK